MPTVNRPVEAFFAQYAASPHHPLNRFIHWICVPLISFSLLGLVWSIPFPELSFLGRGQRYLNWATFLILFVVIYYFRLSGPLALAMLAVISIFAAAIVTLEKLHAQFGWPPLGQVCLGIFILAWVGQFIGHRIAGKKFSFLDDLQFLLIGPIWLLHFIFKKVGLRY